MTHPFIEHKHRGKACLHDRKQDEIVREKKRHPKMPF